MMTSDMKLKKMKLKYVMLNKFNDNMKNNMSNLSKEVKYKKN